MKRTLILGACVMAFITNTANAQLGVSKITKKVLPTLVLGAKVGVNMQQLDGNPYVKTSFKGGVLGGAFVSVDKGKGGIRVEALIKTAKLDYSTSNPTTGSVRTVALDIPVLYEHKIVSRVWFQVGPQFTSLISAKHTSGVDLKNNFKNADVAVVGGLEGRLPLKLTVGARYIKGFLDVNNTPTNDKWTNSSIQIYVGYRFLN